MAASKNRNKLRKLDPEDRLFRHKLRPSWGIGLWIREEKTRRRLVFQDGSKRAFKKGFYHLLVPVEADTEEVEEVLDNLMGDVEMHSMEEDSTDKEPAMPFADQIAVFLHLYPGGFSGKKYQNKYRQPTSGSSRKAHIDPIIASAQQSFSKKRVEKMMDKGQHETLYNELMDIFEATSVVRPKQVREFATEKSRKQIKIVESLHKLLHGKKRYRNRFQDWNSTLTKASGEPSWPLATLLPALINPSKYVCVKRSVFDIQARALSRCKPIRKKVNARRYRNARSISRAVFKNLIEAGLEPADMFDVRNFIWETLRPKGQKQLEFIEGVR